MTDRTGRLELEIVDVHNARITEPVDLQLRHRELHDHRRIDNIDATKLIAIPDLHREPKGLYILQVSAPSYRPVSRFVTIPASGNRREVIPLPIRPERAKAVFPTYDELDERVRGLLERSRKVRGHEGLTGRALYDALSDVAKAGLLNIAKKSLVTEFKNGADLLPHVTLLDSRGDRCFVEVPRALIEQMPSLVDGDLLRAVDGSLHEPPPGLNAAGSFKTLDAFGNLQLTFFENDTTCVADVDIDDAAGLGHVFQVARNHLTGDPTHPFNIHQILMAHQHLDPGYRLLPRG
jgi:hypothetical protein